MARLGVVKVAVEIDGQEQAHEIVLRPVPASEWREPQLGDPPFSPVGVPTNSTHAQQAVAQALAMTHAHHAGTAILLDTERSHGFRVLMLNLDGAEEYRDREWCIDADGALVDRSRL